MFSEISFRFPGTHADALKLQDELRKKGAYQINIRTGGMHGQMRGLQMDSESENPESRISNREAAEAIFQSDKPLNFAAARRATLKLREAV